MVDDPVTVKGSPVRSLQKFVEVELSAEEREAMLNALPPEYASRFRKTILATETVPVNMLNRITEEAAKAKGESLDKFARRAGACGASDAMKGIYRFFAMVMTPPAVLGRAGQMWNTLYNRGEMIVAEQTENSARIRLTDFPSELAGCTRITGWIERMAEMTGVKEITVQHNQCYAKGAKFCEWQLNWK